MWLFFVISDLFPFCFINFERIIDCTGSLYVYIHSVIHHNFVWFPHSCSSISMELEDYIGNDAISSFEKIFNMYMNVFVLNNLLSKSYILHFNAYSVLYRYIWLMECVGTKLLCICSRIPAWFIFENMKAFLEFHIAVEVFSFDSIWRHSSSLFCARY